MSQQERTCTVCGRAIDQHRRNLRFKLPEPVRTVPENERSGRTWGNDVLMQVKEIGSFVRVLVPVHLTGGFTVTFGCWLSVHPDDLKHAWDVWWKPEYAQLELTGVLANMLPGWEREAIAKPLDAAVLNPEEVPYAIGSPDPFLHRVLTEEWRHEPALDAIASFE